MPTIKTAEEVDITLNDVVRYLNETKRQIAGYSCNNKSCVVAEVIKRKYPDWKNFSVWTTGQVIVFNDENYIGHRLITYMLPLWLIDFVVMLDRRYPVSVFSPAIQISGKQALTVLTDLLGEPALMGVS